MADSKEVFTVSVFKSVFACKSGMTSLEGPVFRLFLFVYLFPHPPFQRPKVQYFAS